MQQGPSDMYEYVDALSQSTYKMIFFLSIKSHSQHIGILDVTSGNNAVPQHFQHNFAMNLQCKNTVANKSTFYISVKAEIMSLKPLNLSFLRPLWRRKFPIA